MNAFVFLCRGVLLPLAFCITAYGQQDLPADYLSKEFHKGRREAARALMPDSSVMVVFAAPTRTFANDVEYNYHQNPDLYYFTGYKEPNAVLLLYKNAQTAPDGSTYNEAFFVQARDARQEQWTGRRLGVAGVQEKLGIKNAFTGDRFKTFPWKTTAIRQVFFELPQGISAEKNAPGDLLSMVQSFRETMALPDHYHASVYNELALFAQSVTPATLDRSLTYIKRKAAADEAFASVPEVQAVLNTKDSTDLTRVQQMMLKNPLFTNAYHSITAQLREVKTGEELYLLRKAVEISCAGQAEVMKTLRPDMSELEVQGLHEYIHKHYGSEEVGYGSIVGAGENGCILHYVENSRTRVGENLVLMDVGAAYHGYTADVTRTVPAKGKFSVEEKIIYQLVYDAQEAAFKTLKEGTPWSAANKAALDVIASGLLKLGIISNASEAKKYYPHGLGHHIGLDVPDKSEYGPMKKNMVITIEPGIYIPPNSPCDKRWWGIAVRIEDDLLITKNGYELLSHFAPRSVADIEKLMAGNSVFDNYKLAPLKTATPKKGF